MQQRQKIDPLSMKMTWRVPFLNFSTDKLTRNGAVLQADRSSVCETKKLEMYVKEIMCILQKNFIQAQAHDSTFVCECNVHESNNISQTKRLYRNLYRVRFDGEFIFRGSPKHHLHFFQDQQSKPSANPRNITTTVCIAMRL